MLEPQRVCPRCGRATPWSQARCSHCRDSADGEAPISAYASRECYACPVCTHAIPIRVTRCPRCGWDFTKTGYGRFVAWAETPLGTVVLVALSVLSLLWSYYVFWRRMRRLSVGW